MSILLPGKDVCENLSKKLYKFVWDDKLEKIKKEKILSKSKVNGGLKMPNIANFIYSLKCSWIRRIIVSPTRPWVMLFESSYCSSRELIEYGTYWGTKVKDKISNDFWKEMFYIWNNVYKLCQLKLNLTLSILLSGSIVNWQIVTYSKRIGIPIGFLLLGIFLNQIFRF